jgi:iron-sulfur cluster assembly accessory protein
MSQSKTISVDPKAAAKIREFIDQQETKHLIVRVSLLQTYCMGGAGYAYRLGFEQGTRDGDLTFMDSGIRFIVDNLSLQRLRGTSIDYVESLESQGFVVTNPNAIAKCPCGHHDLFNAPGSVRSAAQMHEMPL